MTTQAKQTICLVYEQRGQANKREYLLGAYASEELWLESLRLMYPTRNAGWQQQRTDRSFTDEKSLDSYVWDLVELTTMVEALS